MNYIHKYTCISSAMSDLDAQLMLHAKKNLNQIDEQLSVLTYGTGENWFSYLHDLHAQKSGQTSPISWRLNPPPSLLTGPGLPLRGPGARSCDALRLGQPLKRCREASRRRAACRSVPLLLGFLRALAFWGREFWTNPKWWNLEFSIIKTRWIPEGPWFWTHIPSDFGLCCWLLGWLCTGSVETYPIHKKRPHESHVMMENSQVSYHG